MTICLNCCSVIFVMLKDLSPLVSLCKRRGFIFPGSEIYGGLSACWDYGPLGVQLKRNLQDLWWQEMTGREDVVGLDCAIFMHPKVWEASGHVKSFSDLMVDCKKCRFRFRADRSEKKCPKCGSTKLTDPRPFHLMFKTKMGSLELDSQEVYLRPETAQGIYVNFLNVSVSLRKKPPFGIAQIGKAFRNEITRGHFIFRLREFEQMEMQYFVPPKEAPTYFQKWLEQRKRFLIHTGLKESQLRIKEHGPDELAHYAQAAADIEFYFPSGWGELEGVHNRGDFDLSQHQKLSGKKLGIFDEASGKSFLPHVVETSIGCDRLILALLCSAYKEEKVGKENRTLLALNPLLSPVQVALLPLSKKDSLIQLTQKVKDLLDKKWRWEYDETGSIGKRYRRHDEIGTPFAITVDFDSLTDGKVTIRNRDTMLQDRTSLEQLNTYLDDKYKIFLS